MKKNLLIFAVLTVYLVACNRDEVPEGYMEHQSVFYRNPVPVQFDSNGDGRIDASDAYIQVLGGNLQAGATPSGGSLYSGESDGVRNGERFCYQNVDRNCEKTGALYSMETALNANWGTLQQIALANMNDANSNGVWDYIDEISAPNSSYTNAVSLNFATQAAQQFVTLLEQATQIVPPLVVESLMQAEIYQVISKTLREIFNTNDTHIDVTKIQEEIHNTVQSIIIHTSILQGWETNHQLDAIATSIAENISKTLSAKIAEDALRRIKSESNTTNNIQGLCPNGFHVPSDADWMMFETALGMTTSEVMQSGIEVTNRGASARVVEKMVSVHGFTYGGYMTQNNLFTQLNDAGVFVSSSVGVDENGYYMWVRQIDKNYSGVIRYKHYEPSGLSIRCFKN